MTGEKYPLDGELHVEFWLPKDASPSGAKGHSGVYLLGRHEIQIFDSFSHSLPNPKQVCGSFWNEIAAKSNAWTAPETWQTIDITLRSPRVNKRNKMTTPGRLTVIHNGQKVINDGRFSTRQPGEPEQRRRPARPDCAARRRTESPLPQPANPTSKELTTQCGKRTWPVPFGSEEFVESHPYSGSRKKRPPFRDAFCVPRTHAFSRNRRCDAATTELRRLTAKAREPLQFNSFAQDS